MSSATPQERRPDDDRSVAATVCDIVRYAPLAILLDGPSLLPQLAEQGKEHVRNARALGPVALRRVERHLRGNFGDLGTQAADLLRATGLVTTASDQAAASAAADGSTNGREATAPAPAASQGQAGPADETAGAAGLQGTDGAAAATPAGSGPRAETLAIPDYDSLSAMQVVNRLPGLAPDELTAVRDYEAGHRSRKTILNRVAQLQAS